MWKEDSPVERDRSAADRATFKVALTMGSGKSQRRRAKNAEKANVSLHKAAIGKGTAHTPLPAAPTKEDYKDKMPASLRRLLALKEVAEQPAKRRKLQEGHVMRQPQQQARGATQASAQQGSSIAGQHGHQQQQQQAPHKQQPGQGQQALAAADGSLVWQQSKRLKQRKKEYLNAKKLKKQGKLKAAHDAEEELPADKPAFGEVVHAPPQVALKSKHWAASSKQQQQQGTGRQLAAGVSKKHKWQRQPQAQDEELQHVREQVIHTYRTGRPAPQQGQATLKSLRELVRRQSHQQGSGGA